MVIIWGMGVILVGNRKLGASRNTCFCPLLSQQRMDVSFFVKQTEQKKKKVFEKFAEVNI